MNINIIFQVVEVMKHFEGNTGIFHAKFVDKSFLSQNPNSTRRSTNFVVKLGLSLGFFNLREGLLQAKEEKVTE